jgi:hypothetical protein
MPENWFDALYTRFLLRDVFAKIAPGFLLLMSVLASLAGSVSTQAGTQTPSATDWSIPNLPTATWIGFLALSWILGFAIQSFGEFIRLIRYYPANMTEIAWRTLSSRFREHARYEVHRQQYERLVVIKEACGNTCASLLVTSLWVLVIFLVNGKLTWDSLMSNLHFVVLDVVLFALLLRMHYVHVQRQHTLVLSVIGTPS